MVIPSTVDEINELKGQFLASLNHEIRTPLSGILGMVDLLLETELTEEQKEYAGSARQCAESLLEIVSVTLEFSALLAHQVTLEEGEFRVRGTLKNLVAELLPKAEAKGLRLLATCDDDVPEVLVGDELRLHHLLGHLANNAIKFTSQGEVELRASGSIANRVCRLQLQVRDTGIGIAPEKLASIFQSFRQLESGLARSYPGLGLGLAISDKLTALMGGELLVKSEPGAGSTFTANIPLRLAKAPSREDYRILLVDDNAIAQTVASHMLRRQSFQVDCVGSGKAALEAAGNAHYDLILMDLQMPGMDGLETASRLREMDGYQRIPIVALTANCSGDFQAACGKHGMQAFLSKPVRPAELLKTVEEQLSACGAS
ncbi:MAG: ATP-binding protein [Acidobacteriota bacterium]|nr:ATP-binding protein [Acidobacteriota bacterium]